MIQKAMTDHKYLTRAYIGGAVAAILMRFAASAAKPGILHLILALIAVAAIVGAAVVSGLCFALVSLIV